MTTDKPTARVIRAERRGPAIVPAELYDAQLAAAQVRAAAEQKAAQLVAAAQIEIERERQAGYAQGYAEGTAQAARELIAITTTRGADEQQLRELALLLAGKLTAGAFERNPAALETMLEPLLSCVRRARKVVIRVQPEAAAFVEARLSKLREAAEYEGVLEVAADPAIDPGGCMIESEVGELDARVSTRLSELARALGWESE
jgi:flagellar biosynthesis/type III secretory pathway protein FliH